MRIQELYHDLHEARREPVVHVLRKHGDDCIEILPIEETHMSWNWEFLDVFVKVIDNRTSPVL